jgi:integral membrane protein
MLNSFRAISIVEGVSYLLILSVAFGIISRDYVFQIGMIHGVLFMLYLVFSLLVCNKQRWSLFIWLPLFFASVIPFAFIPVELYLRKALANQYTETAEQPI